jgi:hypothetical protein
VQKNSPTTGFHPRTVQPVASRCTDYTTPAHPRFTAVRHHSQAIIGSHYRTSMFYQVSSRSAIFKRTVRRHDTLTVPFRSWMTTQTFYTFPFDGEIRVRVMPFNDCYAGNPFSETPLCVKCGFLPQTEHCPSPFERPTCVIYENNDPLR